MSKIRKHSNVKGKGSRNRATVTTFTGKKNPLLRPVSTDAGAAITDNPLNLLVYTGAVMALMFIIKIILN